MSEAIQLARKAVLRAYDESQDDARSSVRSGDGQVVITLSERRLLNMALNLLQLAESPADKHFHFDSVNLPGECDVALVFRRGLD